MKDSTLYQHSIPGIMHVMFLRHGVWCIFVYFDSIVDKPQQFIEGDNKDIDVIILIIKDAYSRTGEF